MNASKSKGTEVGRRLSDLRSGSRSSRHQLKIRKGTRAGRKAAAIWDSRAR